MTTSLQSAIKTYTVNVGAAPRMESERYIGSGLYKTCYNWGGYDQVGRHVTADSYYTKAPGCNSAEDRIAIENQVERPRYYEYIQYNTEGLYGPPMTEPYVPRIGFGNSISSAIASTVPENRQLQADEAYNDDADRYVSDAGAVYSRAL